MPHTMDNVLLVLIWVVSIYFHSSNAIPVTYCVYAFVTYVANTTIDKKRDHLTNQKIYVSKTNFV